MRVHGVDPAGLRALGGPTLRQALWQFMVPVSQLTWQPVTVDDGCELLREFGNGTGCTFWAGTELVVTNPTITTQAAR